MTTLAGKAGESGSNDGVGRDARFDTPEGVAVDDAGNVYVADTLNRTIRKISPSGFVSTVAGTPKANAWPLSGDEIGAAARFGYPTDLAVDAAGNIYVADYHAMRKVTPAGEVTTLAGNSGEYGGRDGMGPEARFYGLRSVALDPVGNIIVTDALGMLKSITPAGVVTTIASQARSWECVDGVGGAARVSAYSFVTFDPAGNLWMSDAEYHVIRRGLPTAQASPPIFTTIPYMQSGTYVAKSTVRLTVECSKIARASYGWSHNGVELPLADESILTLADLTEADTGTYVATATNAAGSVSVAVGTLTITPSPISNLTVSHSRSGGSALWGVAAGNGRVVAVGTGGTILNSNDGVNWTCVDSGTGKWLVGITYGAENFIAVGAEGTILRSPDGLIWSAVTASGTSCRLNNVVHGHGLFVAVGENGTIVTSSDGDHWTPQVSGTTGWLRGLACAEPISAQAPAFVACGQDGVLITSDDGISWRCGVLDAVPGIEALTAVENYASYVAVTSYDVVYEGRLNVLTGFGNSDLATFGWYRLGSLQRHTTHGLVNGANALYALADQGAVFTAPNSTGPWARIPVDTTSTLRAGVFAGTTLYLVGDDETVLTSLPLYEGRLVNISTRGFAGNEDRTLISGFVVQGGEPKKVLVRAVGPALSDYGLNGVLAAPILTLYDRSGRPLASNTRWSTAPNAAEMEAAVKKTGAAPLKAGSADSALLMTLEPGLYTAHVTGVDRSTGLALVEAYDADDLCNQGPKTINVSTRGRVEAGQNRLIAGFVITGESSRRVLIRAAGPGLIPYGVKETLTEPQLTLYTARGNVIRTAGAWSAEPEAGEIREAARLAGAFPFADDSKDAALVVTLNPGVYTVHVTGRNSSMGVALVEVYDLP